MASEVCTTCGLPDELCVCEDVAKEEQEVTITVEKARYDKEVTLIKGLDSEDVDLDDLSSKLKSACACGGGVQEEDDEPPYILLQGNQRERARGTLEEEGFTVADE